MAESKGVSSPGKSAAPEQIGKEEMSPSERLEALSAKATALYGMKDYTAAADVYSEATELQAEVNGEMSIENADLLYAYGRCLFYVAQKTSEVLGGTAAQAQMKQEKERKPSKKKKSRNTANGSTQADSSNSEPASADSKADAIKQSEDISESTNSNPNTKPLFQITGDENWTDSEDDEEEGDGEEEEEEEEDDFANSFELLDLARILYLRKLESLQSSTAEEVDKGKYVASIDLTPPIREIKSRIADIYDLQAEIGLEGEKFDNSVTDLKACLALKEELEPPESSILAECHYKLSLALEVAGQDQKRDESGNPTGDITVNWDLRNESVQHQEKAIESCKLRVSKETKSLEEIQPGPEKDKAMSQIEDVQEMITEMEDRLAELRKPPVNVKAETEKDLNKEMMAGVLGQIMGAGNTSKEEQKAQLAEVIANATDLSGMVKKKKPKVDASASAAASSGGGSASGTKRKVAFVEESSEGAKGKKAKVEEVEDSGL